WGDPLVCRDVDSRSFLSAHDSRSLDDLVDGVDAVDRDHALHLELLGRPWYRGKRVPACADAEMILDRFDRIFSTTVEPVARSRTIRHALGIDRLPAELASIRRRVLRKWRKLSSLVP
ncbi:MAG: hypothetical protein ACKOK8_05665, partial [Planctomycetia bacterium]